MEKRSCKIHRKSTVKSTVNPPSIHRQSTVKSIVNPPSIHRQIHGQIHCKSTWIHCKSTVTDQVFQPQSTETFFVIPRVPLPVNHVDEDHAHVNLKSSTYCLEGEPRWGRGGRGWWSHDHHNRNTQNCWLTNCGFVWSFDFRTRMLTIHTDTGSPSKP